MYRLFGINLSGPFMWQCQNLCRLSLAFIIDLKDVKNRQKNIHFITVSCTFWRRVHRLGMLGSHQWVLIPHRHSRGNHSMNWRNYWMKMNWRKRRNSLVTLLMANWFGGGWMWHSPGPCSSKSWPPRPGSWSRDCSYHSGRRLRKALWRPPLGGLDCLSAASFWTARLRGCPNATSPWPQPFVAAVVSAAVACTAGLLPRPWHRSPKPASEGRRPGWRPHPWHSTWQSTWPDRGCFRPQRPSELPRSF